MGGRLRNRSKDRRCRSIWVLYHFGIPEAKQGPTRRFEVARPHGIRLGLRHMMHAVALDCDFYSAARQIDDEMSDDMLACEAGTRRPQTQPKKALSLGRALSKRASVAGEFGRYALHGVPSIDRPASVYPPPAPPFQGGEEAPLNTTAPQSPRIS